MKFLFLSILIVLHAPNVFSAADSIPNFNKPVIDSTCINQWHSVEHRQGISPDGNYFYFIIANKPSGDQTLVVKSTYNSWSKEFVGISNAYFTGDSKQIIFREADSLIFFHLGTDEKKVISNVTNFLFPKSDEDKWIGYLLHDSINNLVILDLTNNIEHKVKYVTQFAFDNTGNNIVLTADSPTSSETLQVMRWINLENKSVRTKWINLKTDSNFYTFKDFKFDLSGEKLVFTVQQNRFFERKIGTTPKSIWYCENDNKIATKVLDSFDKKIDTAYTVQSIVGFNKNSSRVLFRVFRFGSNNLPASDSNNLNIWSYNDAFLQPDYKWQVKRNQERTFLFATSLDSNFLTRIENEQEFVSTFQVPENYLVVGTELIEPWWNFDPKPAFYLQSLCDGSRRLIRQDNVGITTGNFYFTEDNKWLIFFDGQGGAYFSYDLKNFTFKNITQAIPSNFVSEYAHSSLKSAVAPVAAWVESDSSLLLYDNYDIWKVDPSGKRTATNMTEGYGVKHKIKLRLFNELDKNQNYLRKSGGNILLTGFSPSNKYNGFFRANLFNKAAPEQLTFGPYTYYIVLSQKPNVFSFDDGIAPIKAKKSNLWILTRQSFNDAPNYFCTNDFKSFKRLTNIQPQKAYNWLKAELIKWKQFDGTIGEGILYKPENFNPECRYPLIINYYEQFSHQLYQFAQPEYTESSLNIPWFVSRGYLVFLADIQFHNTKKTGRTAYEWALNSIASAAVNLGKLTFVNKNKIGLQGHSFGGGETNYLIAHSNLFAAAAEAAGDTDPISAYLTLVPFVENFEHYSKQSVFEDGQAGLNYTPWQRPDLYLKNSIVLSADKIKTPLLIMHNESDNNIQWRQGVELYMAMRRLGKKVWMLQYRNGGHSVVGKDAIDYTTRLEQFFNYYLKMELPPVWMTHRIQPNLNKIQPSFELDSSGQIP